MRRIRFIVIDLNLHKIYFMKSISHCILLSLFFFTACQKQKKSDLNHFPTTPDTLLVKMTKEKGDGLFQIGATTPTFKSVTSEFPYSIIYPKRIENAERFLFMPNFREKKHYYVDIIKGTQDGNAVFIVDENNNNDLTDDSIRPIEAMDWNSDKSLVKCNFSVSEGIQTIQDFSWLKIGTSNNSLLVGRSDHLIGTFNINKKTYKITAADPFNSSFSYDINPQLAVITDKNTIANRDIVSLGEFIKLGNTYYKFHSISDTGSQITLIKEDNFQTKIGTQVGMLAPEFTAITTEKDTIKSVNLNNRLTIIANSCGCGGDKASTQAYYDMRDAYTNINILHVDSKIKKATNGLHIDVDNDFNKAFYNTYRKQYCLRICYVIGKDNRILDTFLITNWKASLTNIVKE